jgi:hypothetical protein
MTKKQTFTAVIQNASEASGGGTFLSAIMNLEKGRKT